MACRKSLAYLSSRHRMILFTKGEPAEEAAKVERSGLQGFFDSNGDWELTKISVRGILIDKHHVVKSARLVDRCKCADMWINPASQAGLNAAFVPHAPTWDKEGANRAKRHRQTPDRFQFPRTSRSFLRRTGKVWPSLRAWSLKKRAGRECTGRKTWALSPWSLRDSFQVAHHGWKIVLFRRCSAMRKPFQPSNSESPEKCKHVSGKHGPFRYKGIGKG